VTKWVEAKAVVKATKQDVSDFLFEEIFTRYEAPRESFRWRGTIHITSNSKTYEEVWNQAQGDISVSSSGEWPSRDYK